jgi:hypothetical protein
MYGVHMEIYVVFRGKPPAEWAEVPGVKAVSADSLTSIEGKFVLVVGDRELAERLKVGYLTEEEARELLDYHKEVAGGGQLKRPGWVGFVDWYRRVGGL